MMSTPDLTEVEALMVRAVVAATEAGALCRAHGTRGKAADARISAEMRAVLDAMPRIVQICEEVPDSHAALADSEFAFLIDPIDGTDGFDRGAAEYAHMVALMVDGWPKAAALACPGYGWLLSGQAGRPALHECQLTLAGDVSAPSDLLPGQTHSCRAIIGQSEFNEPVLARLANLGAMSVALADSAVAFGHLLRGDADLFLRTQPNREWDIAAGHALLEIAGGTLLDLDGAPMRYGKPGLRNSGFVAYSAAFRPS